ncbi:E3 ubiquitin-protein ligase RNF135-like [Brachionichthys hirsutus]|uniref:E3 ubiquitin-protein ligase RNF135-like n=1 Tax=Brachionichthys hirsutus TaxID=412623 RepID=UPI0036044162
MTHERLTHADRCYLTSGPAPLVPVLPAPPLQGAAGWRFKERRQSRPRRGRTQEGVQKDRENLSCSYCLTGVKAHWDNEDEDKICCPQCRRKVTPSPVLHKDTMLEDPNKTGVQAAPADPRWAGPEDVGPEVSPEPLQQRVQDSEEDVEALQREVEAIDHDADRAVEDSEEIFSEMIRLMAEKRRHVEQQVRAQQQKEVSRVREQLHRGLENPPDPGRSPSIRPPRYFEEVAAVTSKLRDQVQDVLNEMQIDFSPAGPTEPEPKTRSEFMAYSREITLDPNTANRRLLLSEGNRKVQRMPEAQGYSSHPDRFSYYGQVLSNQSLTGRCYWEVDWGDGEGGVAVAYKDIGRDGEGHQSLFGRNERSWMLYGNSDSYQFYHDSLATPVPGPWSSRVGVYLDHGAGVLSFYCVSEMMTLLHRVQTTFTQPLHVGLRPYFDGIAAELCDLKSTQAVPLPLPDRDSGSGFTAMR